LVERENEYKHKYSPEHGRGWNPDPTVIHAFTFFLIFGQSGALVCITVYRTRFSKKSELSLKQVRKLRIENEKNNREHTQKTRKRIIAVFFRVFRVFRG